MERKKGKGRRGGEEGSEEYIVSERERVKVKVRKKRSCENE